MIITNKKQLKVYKQACNLSTQILAALKDKLKSGIYPIDIDDYAQQLCKQYKVKSAFIDVGKPDNPYKYATCISINDTVVHGIPSKTRKIKKGDIVKIDFGIIYQGFYTDHCFTVSIGPPKLQDKKLILTAKKAVQSAISLAIVNNTVGDLGHAMQSIANKAGFDVLKKYTGHGIGKTLHDPPIIPAHGKPNTGPKLQQGMVICLEAQVVAGNDQVYIAQDGWTVKMKDHQNTAMFEYIVVVDKNKPKILTHTLDWSIIV